MHIHIQMHVQGTSDFLQGFWLKVKAFCKGTMPTKASIRAHTHRQKHAHAHAHTHTSTCKCTDLDTHTNTHTHTLCVQAMAVGEHRVFIKNLPFTISEPEIRRNILALGLNDAVAVRINRAGKSYGVDASCFGFVTMSTAEGAAGLIECWNGNLVFGRWLHAEVAVPRVQSRKARI